ncbi:MULTISPECIES: hypothetical protein [Niallia]|uniref:hypothetical protein n=1 Tax=Niallia TaxID=2837506 RepID=UPI0003329AEC|nr:hypothetical protein A499_18134 [Niallia nealsonii AAU1]
MYQEQMATLIAMKNKAAGAINGDVSSDGLNAMLGDTGDLQSMLIQSIKKGNVLQGSTEEWVAEASDRAREILSNIGKPKNFPLKSNKEYFEEWANKYIKTDSSRNVLIRKSKTIASNIEKGKIPGFHFNGMLLEVDLYAAFGSDSALDGEIVDYLTRSERESKTNNDSSQISLFDLVEEKPEKKNKRRVVSGQLAFELF